MKPRLAPTLTSQPYYTLKLPCKPYIKKYATALFGDPVKVSPNSTLGHVVMLALEKNVYENRWFKEGKWASFQRTHSDIIECSMTHFQFENFGTDIKKEAVLQINRFLENSFDDFLYLYVSARLVKHTRYNGTNDRILSFAEKYGLNVAVDPEDDGDITYDALKKKYTRRLKKNQ